jgi:hypothetical protein
MFTEGNPLPLLKKKDELVPVTSEDVAQAKADVENARASVEDLRERFINGDDSVTQEQISSQAGVFEWLVLVAVRAEKQRERYETAYAVQARKDLKAEILTSHATANAQALTKLNVLIQAVRDMEDLGAIRDAEFYEWAARAKALGVPTGGVMSPEGMGLEGDGSAILVDSMHVEFLNVQNLFRLIFDVINNGIVLTKDESRVSAARAHVDQRERVGV